MTEFIEMRFRNRPADGLLDGYFESAEILGRVVVPKIKILVVRVHVDAHGTRLRALAELADKLWYWRIDRKYTKDETRGAEMFRLICKPNAVSEQGCEEHGTEYDTSSTCAVCGAGRMQTSELVLDLRRLPKKGGFATTLSDEPVVSQQTAEILLDHKLTGFSLRPVRHRSSKFDGPLTLSTVPSGRQLIERGALVGIRHPSAAFSLWMSRKENEDLFYKAMAEGAMRFERLASKRPLPVWYQIVSSGQPVSLSSATQFGLNPLDHDAEGKYRCPFGHTKGWSVLSEAFVERSTWDGSDYCVTTQLYGQHAGLYYARPLVLMSRKMREALTQARVPGVTCEVAHLVNSNNVE